MTVVERRIAVIGAIVIEAGGGRAWLGPGVDPHLTVLLGVAAAFDFGVDKASVRAARRAFLRVVLGDRLLARRQKLVEHEEVVAGVALCRILAQLTLRDERMGAVDDDQLLEHFGVIHRKRPRHVGAPVVADQNELLVFAGNFSTNCLTSSIRWGIVYAESLRPRRQVVAAHVEADGQMIAAHFDHLILPLYARTTGSRGENSTSGPWPTLA